MMNNLLIGIILSALIPWVMLLWFRSSQYEKKFLVCMCDSLRKMAKYLKYKFIKHEHNWIYKGITGGMGFLSRNIECSICERHQHSLTCTSSFYDELKAGQKLTKEDFNYMNNDIY